MTAIVIGAGIGGLSAAIALARRGQKVVLLEARDGPGGLASGFEIEGRWHDGGPYILLDRPGLGWAFEQWGEKLEAHVELIPLREIYRVRRPDAPDVIVRHDVHETADGIAASFGAKQGERYRALVRKMTEIHGHLAPLQRSRFEGATGLIKRGLLKEGMFLLKGLESHLEDAGLDEPLRDALGIWTHIAGQAMEDAPAPMAFVPALMHGPGSFTVRGGLGKIALALHAIAEKAGVDLRFGAKVARIVRDGKRVGAVETEAGEHIEGDLVFSNAPGVATYTKYLDPRDEKLARKLDELPLQSPGVAAYLHAEVSDDVPFLQFWLPGGGQHCRVLVHAGRADDTRKGTLRLVTPTDHLWAEQSGETGQRALLSEILAEPWWQTGITNRQVVATRVPVTWGQSFHLWRDSMNPTMTATFMRQGRIPHQSPVAKNLYLCGSATHPGQWVSFCAISGLLAVEEALG